MGLFPSFFLENICPRSLAFFDRDRSVRLTGDLYQRLAHPSNELQLGALGSAPPSSAQATDESTTGIV